MLPEDELRLVAEELKGTFTKDPSFNDTRMRESPRHAFSLQGVGSENLSETAALVSPESKDAMLLSGEYPGVPSSASPESGGSVELERANSFSESTAIPQRNNNNNNDRSVLVRRGVRHNSTFSVEHLSPEDQTYVRARASTKPRNPTFTDSESEGNKPD